LRQPRTTLLGSRDMWLTVAVLLGALALLLGLAGCAQPSIGPACGGPPPQPACRPIEWPEPVPEQTRKPLLPKRDPKGLPTVLPPDWPVNPARTAKPGDRRDRRYTVTFHASWKAGQGVDIEYVIDGASEVVESVHTGSWTWTVDNVRHLARAEIIVTPLHASAAPLYCEVRVNGRIQDQRRVPKPGVAGQPTRSTEENRAFDCFAFTYVFDERFP